MKRFPVLLLAALLLAVPAFADSDLDCQVIAEAYNPVEAGATDSYLNLTDGTFGATATADDEFTVPVEVKVWGLSADVDVAPGAGDEWTITVVDDTAVTLVTCSITGTGTSCENVNDVATVAAGSDLMVLTESDAGAGDPAAAAEMRISFCIDLDR